MTEDERQRLVEEINRTQRDLRVAFWLNVAVDAFALAALAFLLGRLLR